MILMISKMERKFRTMTLKPFKLEIYGYINISIFSKILSKNVSINEQIVKEKKVSQNHLSPELKLNLITSTCRLWKSTSFEPFNSDPFWGFYWPGGQSLSRYVIDNEYLIKGKTVLDFGCGCGACGLSAKIKEAKSVIFNDVDRVALAAVEVNAHLNGVSVDEAISDNLIGNECLGVDVILVGDMLYDSQFSADVLAWLTQLADRGKKVFIGDPGRFSLVSLLNKNKLKCVAKYKLPHDAILENNGFTDAFVWELNG